MREHARVRNKCFVQSYSVSEEEYIIVSIAAGSATDESHPVRQNGPDSKSVKAIGQKLT